MTCWPTKQDGNLDVDPPDRNGDEIAFRGEYRVTDLGPNSNGVNIPADDPEVINRGGGYVDTLIVRVQSQVKQSGDWNLIKETQSQERSTLQHAERHTVTRDSSGPNKTYRTRTKAIIKFCDGSQEDTNWKTSGERDL